MKRKLPAFEQPASIFMIIFFATIQAETILLYYGLLWMFKCSIYAWSYKPTIQILAVVQLINWHSCMGRRAVILRIISYDDFNFRYVYHTRHAHHSHTFATLKN